MVQTRHAIRQYREKQKPPLTREQLAERLGVTRQAVWRWEEGKRTPGRELLPQISAMTGVPILELMGLSE